MTDTLKPCPSPRCDVSGVGEGPKVWSGSFSWSTSWVECGCGMRGPKGSDDEEAQELWNELPRTSTPEGEALREIASLCTDDDRLRDQAIMLGAFAIRSLTNDIVDILARHGIQLPALEMAGTWEKRCNKCRAWVDMEHNCREQAGIQLPAVEGDNG